MGTNPSTAVSAAARPAAPAPSCCSAGVAASKCSPVPFSVSLLGYWLPVNCVIETEQIMCTHETLPGVLAFPQTRWRVSPGGARGRLVPRRCLFVGTDVTRYYLCIWVEWA